VEDSGPCFAEGGPFVSYCDVAHQVIFPRELLAGAEGAPDVVEVCPPLPGCCWVSAKSLCLGVEFVHLGAAWDWGSGDPQESGPFAAMELVAVVG